MRQRSRVGQNVELEGVLGAGFEPVVGVKGVVAELVGGRPRNGQALGVDQEYPHPRERGFAGVLDSVAVEVKPDEVADLHRNRAPFDVSEVDRLAERCVSSVVPGDQLPTWSVDVSVARLAV